MHHIIKDKTPLKKIKKDFIEATKEKAKFNDRKKGLVKLRDVVE